MRKPLLITLIVGLAVLAVVAGSLVARHIVLERRASGSSAGDRQPGSAQGSSPGSDLTRAPTNQATTAPPDFSGVFAKTRGSVVRVIASTCQGSGIGSGFLVRPDLVVASYPSVSQSVAIVVQIGDQVIPARVAGADPQTGVALLHLMRSAGKALPVAQTNAPLGQDLLTVGLPFRTDEPDQLQGPLTGEGGSVTYQGSHIDALFSLAGSNDRGLTGAPVVDAAGDVVGAVLTLPSTAGRWVVGADRLRAGIDRARSQPASRATCGRPTGPHSDTRIKGQGSADLKKGLLGYFSGINSGDEAAAWRNMGPRYHKSGWSLSSFDWTSTYDFDITIHRTWSSAGRQRAWVTFVAINAPKYAPKGLEGQWCARWSFDYELSDGGDRLLIDGNPGHAGSTTKMETC